VLAAVLALAVAAAPGAAPPRAPSPPPAPRPAPPPGPGQKGAAPGADDPLERRRAAVADELVRVGARLQREIQAGDVDALLARIPAEGLACGGRIVPRARVERDLRDPASWLHGVVLGDGTLAAAGAPPSSLRAFFARAPEVAVLVAFRRDPRAGPVGRPCVDFRAKELPTPGVPFCFESREGRWWLTESLYPCG
jgi:hypothetical protein